MPVGVFCVAGKNKNSRYSLNIRSLLLFAFSKSGATSTIKVKL